MSRWGFAACFAGAPQRQEMCGNEGHLGLQGCSALMASRASRIPSVLGFDVSSLMQRVVLLRILRLVFTKNLISSGVVHCIWDS